MNTHRRTRARLAQGSTTSRTASRGWRARAARLALVVSAGALALRGSTAHAVVYLDGQPDSNFTAAANASRFERTVWLRGTYQGQTFYSSGTLLDSHNVLLTAHQLNVSGTPITFDAVGTGNFSTPGQIAGVSDVVTFAGYAPGGAPPDLAIAHLSTPVGLPLGATPAPIASASIGQTVWGSGYGFWGHESDSLLNAPDGARRAWSAPVSGSTFGYSADYYYSGSFGSFGPMNGRGANLDSGGGWYDESGQLVGISVAAGPGGTIVQNLQNPEVSAWIQDNLRIVPEPGPVAFLLAGIGAALASRHVVRRANTRRITLATAAAIGTLAPAAHAVIYLDGQPDSNFTTAAQDPRFSRTAWVNATYLGQPFYTSAVILDSHNLLFTAHQVNLGGVPIQFLSAGTGNFNAPPQSAPIADVVSYPAYNADGSTPDLAIIHLASPLDSYHPPTFATVSDSQSIWGSGYGFWGTVSASFLNDPDGQKRAWTALVDLSTTFLSGYNPDYYFTARFNSGGLFGTTNGRGANLDSGGGWYDADGRLVGMSVAVNVASTIVQDLTNPEIQSWIAANLKVVPEPATAWLLLAGPITMLAPRRRRSARR